MSEETTPAVLLYLEALGKSLSEVDDFGFGDYRNHLPRWVYALLLLGMTYASM